ncbi:hypothetical protein A8W25_01810 [Streptomyces sp. ERV7]|uniref:hypothetical protein n=1 Tax=Streptomyces sp. ERV7 TaxID=1322334 RepID=UPI0007F50F8D|nr:hypothetical protein [Streptomyces sp. ERV7]OAR27039.1 hypothetical protein A8W25_01810 [Streptomyces sp. ERV7]
MDRDAAQGPETAHRAELTGAYWLSTPARPGLDCEWCTRLREADRRDLPRAGARGAGWEGDRMSPARAAMMSLALVTIVLAMAMTAAHL